MRHNGFITKKKRLFSFQTKAMDRAIIVLQQKKNPVYSIFNAGRMWVVCKFNRQHQAENNPDAPERLNR